MLAAYHAAASSIGHALNGAELEEWEIWPNPAVVRSVMSHVAVRRPWGLELRFPRPRPRAERVELRDSLRRLATYQTPWQPPRHVRTNEQLQEQLQVSSAELLCLSVLHPRERVAYDHHARVVREDHACAFRWLAKLYDEGHDLTPASCFYLGRAYLRGECGVLVDRERAECFLADVVANHDMCPSYAEMGLSTGDC